MEASIVTSHAVNIYKILFLTEKFQICQQRRLVRNRSPDLGFSTAKEPIRRSHVIRMGKNENLGKLIKGLSGLKNADKLDGYLRG